MDVVVWDVAMNATWDVAMIATLDVAIDANIAIDASCEQLVTWLCSVLRVRAVPGVGTTWAARPPSGGPWRGLRIGLICQ
jgi:hypothetical protein